MEMRCVRKVGGATRCASELERLMSSGEKTASVLVTKEAEVRRE